MPACDLSVSRLRSGCRSTIPWSRVFAAALVWMVAFVAYVHAQPTTAPGVPVRGFIVASPGAVPGAATLAAAVNLPPRFRKQVYLPGVEVFVEEASTHKTSGVARTDLSGRFTVFAPGEGRYHVCWKSPVYGSGCDTAFVSVGNAPEYVSAVHIPLPPKDGFVAFLGHVTDGDGEVPRTFEPFLNINAFATVSLRDKGGQEMARVFVNNDGDYLLPYVPIKETLSVVASMEGAKRAQEIRPEARIEALPASLVNLKFSNRKPRLDPVRALDTAGKRVQTTGPGSTLRLEASARDPDGDAVKFAWFVGEGQGKAVQINGGSLTWQLPDAPGRYTAQVVAYDDNGGYARGEYAVVAGAPGVSFSGVVVTPAGAPVPGASVEVVGNAPIPTNSSGRFATQVAPAERYVVNIRKEGFALNSHVYDGAVAGGRWILRPAQVVTVDPTRPTRISHKRGRLECTGPDAIQAGLGVAGESLIAPQWQNGKGEAIDPPAARRPIDVSGISTTATMATTAANAATGVTAVTRATSATRATGVAARSATTAVANNAINATRPVPVILPRGLKLPPCGPGISVQIPANAILDAEGRPAKSPIKVGISTIDVLSPQQMPGDDSVRALSGNGAYLQSFGAGALDLPPGFKLKPGVTATITIPVDRVRLVNGAHAMPASVPLLSYNEKTGLWTEEGKMTLSTVGGVPSYTAKVKHFTTYNADTLFGSAAACVRVFSPSLPGQYDLEAITPYPDGTPHYKKYAIDNVSATEHVIYNITPNVNITLTPMTQGPNPQVLGFYVVNSGGPQVPSTSPNPPPYVPGQGYTSCQNFVVFKINGAPDSPAGGEFLHGLGYVDAANLGFDDLTAAGPTGNALVDAIAAASRNYNTQVDPNSDRDTFAKFKTKNGFDQSPGTKVTVAPPGAGEFVAQYANSGDLGFGRDMHCLKKANGDVACYVTNYGNGYTSVAPGAGTDDHVDADDAGQRNAAAEVATVAMEYSAIENDPVGDKVVKFYVYKKGIAGYGRSISANLDGRGERPVPQLCMICHGGAIPSQSGGVPAFGSAGQVKLQARFVPFDHRFFTFPTNPANLTQADQEAAFKNLNQQIVAAAPPVAASDPIQEVVSGIYNNGASATQIHDFVVPGWAGGASANVNGQSGFYTGVVANVCRTCHISQPYGQLQFNSSDKFVNLGTAVAANNHVMLGTAQQRVCADNVMPHALRTHDIFWNVYWDVASWGPPPTPFYSQFQAFGDGIPNTAQTWQAGLCTSFVSGQAATPSHFYEQTIQPIWNGKCVVCHVSGGIAPFSLAEGVSFALLRNGTRVLPGNDADNAGTLLQRITGVGPGSKMPLGCIAPPTPPGPTQLPCLDQIDIDRIKAWIRSGAN